MLPGSGQSEFTEGTEATENTHHGETMSGPSD
jgi:hypothetical protein